MDEFHERLIRIGLDALGERFGYALAGGYAIRAHRIVDRLSEDVDLFAPMDRRGEMPAAMVCVTAAYAAAGLQVELDHQAETYTRLMVSDAESGAQSKVELVAEFLGHPPVESEYGPMLHRDDVAAGKMSALFSRAELRDAIDVDGLLRAGYSKERLLGLAAERDAGFDLRMFADSLGAIRRFGDERYAAYGIDAGGAAAIRQRCEEWRCELLADSGS
ncbi:nucleotidyl transferase AbiEii/AbiGii toxin family protein [Streptomyces boninensis]|uniref:nucleotidyl transferase AbiEii/AbiGii toxin family protein n=1 Tax=Streptomyces boninensis TaxID=2039455 RepID=UPI003B20DE10